MTRLTIIFFAITWTICSCTLTSDKAKINNEKQDALDQSVSHLNYNDSLPNRRFKASEIINPKFDKKLIFGVWTLSYDDPACDFELNEKRFLICDYDGDGERFYKIVNDSIFLDNPYLIFKGRIIKATGDTLVIHWQENEEPKTLLRWRD